MLKYSDLSPVNDAIMGLLKTSSIFFIFFSIINGISSMGSMATFNKLGKKMFRRLILISLFSVTFFCLLSAFIFPLASGGDSRFDLSGLWQMIFSIIPVNFVESFLSGNTMQISFLSIVIGVIILILGEKGKNISSLISDLSDVIRLLLQGIIRCLPVTVFISIFTMILTGDLSEVTDFYKYPLSSIFSGFLVTAFFVGKTCAAQKLPVKTFLRKFKSVALIALTTSSDLLDGDTLRSTERI